jgi:hypothetical protein
MMMQNDRSILLRIEELTMRLARFDAAPSEAPHVPADLMRPLDQMDVPQNGKGPC